MRSTEFKIRMPKLFKNTHLLKGFRLSLGLIACAGTALCAAPSMYQIPLNRFQLNGSAQLTGSNAITLTNHFYQAGSAFIPTRYPLGPNDSFCAYFVYAAEAGTTEAPADGLAFVAQSLGVDSPNYLGLSGSGLGFFTLTTLPAVAVTFDYTSNSISGSPAGTLAIATTNGQDLIETVPMLPILPSTGSYRAVWVDYKNTDRVLKVFYSNTSTRPAIPALYMTLPTDLSTLFGGYIYFGVTGGTGAGYSSQQLLYFAIDVLNNP